VKIDYEVIVQGSSKRVVKDHPEGATPDDEARMFCQKLYREGLMYQGEWYPPHEIARVQWHTHEPIGKEFSMSMGATE
jgi:hypothetical protein